MGRDLLRKVQDLLPRLGLDSEQAVREIKSADPRSALVRRLAEELGVEPEVAAARLQQASEEAENEIARQSSTKGWICRVYGDPQCSYRLRPDAEQWNAIR